MPLDREPPPTPSTPETEHGDSALEHTAQAVAFADAGEEEQSPLQKKCSASIRGTERDDVAFDCCVFATRAYPLPI